MSNLHVLISSCLIKRQFAQLCNKTVLFKWVWLNKITHQVWMLSCRDKTDFKVLVIQYLSFFYCLISWATYRFWIHQFNKKWLFPQLCKTSQFENLSNLFDKKIPHRVWMLCCRDQKIFKIGVIFEFKRMYTVSLDLLRNLTCFWN